MKPSRPRIFIVGKVVRATQAPKEKVLGQAEGESPQKERAGSKRRRLFQEVARGSSREKQEKYQYQIVNHIQAESLGTILNCDLMGSSGSEQKRREQRGETNVARSQLQPEIDIPHKNKEAKAKASIPVLATINEPLQQNAHNSTLTSPRVKIFDGINAADFRANAHLSSLIPLSSLRRRGIFTRHESQQHPLSLNTSLSKQRRRIFSTGHNAPFLQPLLSQHHKAPPLQPTIKEEQELSRITEVVQESVQQSRLPPSQESQL